MKKYYRVSKDTFLWEKGSIINNTANEGKGYEPIDSIFKKFDDRNEYISDSIIEHNPEWFERVYPVNLLTKISYKTKEEAKDIIQKMYE